MRMLSLLAICSLFFTAAAFMSSIARSSGMSRSKLQMVDVEVVFPGNKKCKAASGSLLKDAAKKAKYSPNYGCEEGKCGSCELKVNGKTKIRPCIGKVPAAGPVVLTEL